LAAGLADQGGERLRFFLGSGVILLPGVVWSLALTGIRQAGAGVRRAVPPGGMALLVGPLPALADLGRPGLKRLENLRSLPRFTGLDPQAAHNVRDETLALQAEPAPR
jgi:hypothetical protein